MEIIGLLFLSAVASVVSIVAALTSLAIRPLRRFALAILLTPPASVVSMILIAWEINDSGRVCGLDPEWDRCPDIHVRTVGWVVWLALTSGTAAISYWGQLAFRNGHSFLFRSESTAIFRSHPENDHEEVSILGVNGSEKTLP